MLLDKKQLKAHLIDVFSIIKHRGFNIIEWIDEVGVSWVEEEGGYASLYKVGILDKDSLGPSKLKKLFVTVSYGKRGEEGITLGSGRKGLFDPIDLEYREEFKYDSESNKLYYENKIINALELFNIVKNAHLSPTRPIRGAKLRIRLWFWRRCLPALIILLDKLFQIILWIISGERLKDSLWSRFWYREKTEQVTTSGVPIIESGKTIDFFGYKAKRHSVVFYAVLHLVVIALLICQDISVGEINALTDNSFIVLCYVVVSFAITEVGMPAIFKLLIKKTMPQALAKVSFKSIRIT